MRSIVCQRAEPARKARMTLRAICMARFVAKVPWQVVLERESEGSVNNMLGRYAAFAIVAAMQVAPMTTAYGQTPTTSGPAGGPPQSRDDYGQGPSGEGPSDEASSPVDLPVLFVTSVEILQMASDPKIDVVSVTGLTAS